MVAIFIASIVTGSVYGLIGTGLVLTYTTSGIFNFAYGAIASIGVYLYLDLRANLGVSLAIVLPLCLIVLPVAIGWLLEPLAQRLTEQHLTIQVAAIVGVYLTVEAVADLTFGVNTQVVPAFLPADVFKVLGVYVGVAQIATLAVSVVAVLLLNGLLKKTRRGVEMRAVVDNSELVALSGSKPRAVRRLAWMISSFLAILSGLLISPSIGIDPQDLTSLSILAFATAALGAFRNINVAYLGGFLVAIPEDLLARYVNSTSLIGSLSQNLPFILLVVIIVFYPKRAFLRASVSDARGRLVSASHLPLKAELPIAACVLVALLLVPEFAGFRIVAWSASMAITVLLLSLGALVRISGQVSLSHMAFAAIGVSAFAALTAHTHLPWLLALLLAGVAAIPFALMLAVPAIRLSGLFLALGTFGFGYALLNMFYQTNLMFGPGDQGISVRAPTVGFINFLSPNNTYYLMLAFVVLSSAAVIAIERSRGGRLLRGMADARVGLESLGVSVSGLQMLVFAISAFLAAVAGVLIGVSYSSISGTSYWPDSSLLYFVVLVIVVGRAPWFAVVAGLGVAVLPTFYQGAINYYLQIVFGVTAIALGLGFSSGVHAPVARWLRSLAGARGSRSRPTAQVRAAAGGEGGVTEGVADGAREVAAGDVRLAWVEDADQSTPVRGEVLEAFNVSVAFGGLVALDAVSIATRPGEIVGVIGPNGAGKTTLFNVFSGLQRPRSGVVRYGGVDITRKTSSWRARSGIGRTFQHMELFESMTVAENVRLGREGRLAGAHLWRMLVTRRGERSDVRESATSAVAACGLGELEQFSVASLSTGSRRLVELARCLAADFDILLLDEPSAGLDQSESRALGAVLRQICESRGVGVLLIEHDMELIMNTCSYVYVLDFGKKIFEGTPAEARASREVQAAYLGLIEEAV